MERWIYQEEMKPLSRDAETKAIIAVQQEPRETQKYYDSLEMLIDSNMGALVKEANVFAERNNLDIRDVLCAGICGYVKGIKRFDTNSANRLNAYAIWYSRKEMRKAVHGEMTIALPHYLVTKIMKIKELRNEKDQTDEKICEQLDLNQQKLQEIESSEVSVFSIDQQIRENNTQDQVGTCHDILPDYKATGADEKLMNQEKIMVIKQLVEELDPIDRDIICCQCLNEQKTSLKELGKKYCRSAQCIAQHKMEAMKYLRGRIQEELMIGV